MIYTVEFEACFWIKAKSPLNARRMLQDYMMQGGGVLIEPTFKVKSKEKEARE